MNTRALPTTPIPPAVNGAVDVVITTPRPRLPRPPKPLQILRHNMQHDAWMPIEGLDLGRFPLRMRLEACVTSSAGIGVPLGYWVIQLRCVVRVVDRASDDGHEIDVVFGRSVLPQELELRGDEEVLLSFVREAVLHELDECWLVHSTRTRDPHAGGDR